MTLYKWCEAFADELTTVRNKYLALYVEIEPEEHKRLAKFHLKVVSGWIRAVRFMDEDVEL